MNLRGTRCVDQASQDFLVPIGEATQQFTKLNAAARASGYVQKSKRFTEVWRQLTPPLAETARSCKASCLLPSRSSKSKVQAEELGPDR